MTWGSERSPGAIRKRALGFALALLALAAPARVFADYQASFRRGFQALERKQYAEAAAQLREAIRERSQEGGDEVRITGGFFSPYLPHYYLGVALLRLGECDGAMAAWKESERQGFIARTGEIGKLRAYRDQCIGPLLARSLQAAQEELANAERRQRSLRTFQGGLPDRQIWSGLAGREAEASALLEKARRRLEEGQRNRDPDALEEARQLAARAARDLQGLQDQGNALLAQWQRSQPRSGPPPQAPERPAPTVPTAPPAAAPEVRETLAEKTPPAETPAVPPNAARPVPPPLLQAARAYFTADYSRALRLLARASFEDRRAAAQAALFRAAARMALYWRDAGRDAELLRAARRDLRDCRRMDPQVRVDARVFSPRFKSFFDQNR